MSTLQTRRLTADELFATSGIGRCELVHGELIMMSPAGFEHGEIALRIARLLANLLIASGSATQTTDVPLASHMLALSSDEIRDEPLLPGFVLPLSKIYKRP